MRVVHGIGWYFPDGQGGTERYVAGLCAGLQRRGIRCDVVAPAEYDATYEHAGVTVHRYSVERDPTRAAVREDAPSARLVEVLRQTGADIYHQHSVTRGLGASSLPAARALGMRTVHTMHTATPVCLRGTLLLADGVPCDGEVRVDRCAPCWLRSRGKSTTWAAIPGVIGAAALLVAPNSRVATALGTAHAVATHRERLHGLFRDADVTIVGSRWHRDVLSRNAIEPASLRVVEPGLDDDFTIPTDVIPEGRIRILFVGRLEPMKGLQLLLAAMKSAPCVDADLVVIASLPPADSPFSEFAREQLANARAMGAIVLEAGGPAEVAGWMARSDIVAIPSQVLETGPLVALEALASGAWIVGSALGGIGERVPSDAGTLVTGSTVDDWRIALSDAIGKAPARRACRRPRRVRRSDDVASEMSAIYAGLA